MCYDPKTSGLPAVSKSERGSIYWGGGGGGGGVRDKVEIYFKGDPEIQHLILPSA